MECEDCEVGWECCPAEPERSVLLRDGGFAKWTSVAGFLPLSRTPRVLGSDVGAKPFSKESSVGLLGTARALWLR